MARPMPLISQALALVAPPFCWGCGGDARRSQPLCRDCRGGLTWLGHEPFAISGLEAWAPLAYEGAARALVRGFKFRGAAGLAGPMAAQIVAGAPAGLLGPRAVLVPVPLHAARARRRGFNQAERLAAALARRTGMPLSDCLRRHGGRRAPQVGRGRGDRLAGIAGAVGLRAAMEAPSDAILVDDVVTTGATLAACSRVLRSAGARRVRAVAYARTQGR